jgi:PHP family Zn ribbon phosphoesterase
MKFKCKQCKIEFKLNMAIPNGATVKQECPNCGSMQTQQINEKVEEPPSTNTNEP